MEVHSHAHTPRRKWTHYFWEFLMLFLAVFCGFLAENQREHLVEHKRAKDYAKTLLNDLRADTNELRRGIHQTKFIMSCIDSLISISIRINSNESVPGRFYYCSKFVFNGFRIDWSRSTMDQIIQSGNLRYFRDPELVGTIQFYYQMQGIISEQNQMDLAHRDRILDFRNRVLQSRYYSVFAPMDIVEEEYDHVPSAQIDSIINKDLPLQKNALEYLDEYINHITDRKARLERITDRYYTLANKLAIDIINMLKEEFHLKYEE